MNAFEFKLAVSRGGNYAHKLEIRGRHSTEPDKFRSSFAHARQTLSGSHTAVELHISVA